MVNRNRREILRIGVVGFAYVVLGCPSTRPHRPFYQVPDTLEGITDEVSKIPDLALEKKEYIDEFKLLQKRFPAELSATFTKMYLDGKPDKRKYCTPLQAMCWLFEDGKKSAFERLAKTYDLRSILDETWIKMRSLRNDPPGCEKNCFEQYEERYRKRWSDPEQIRNRLNSMRIMEMYTIRGRIVQWPQEPELTLMKRKGDCKAYAIMAVHCLKPAGYDASFLTMDPYSEEGHTVCLINEWDGYYNLDNLKGLKGPFEKINDIKRLHGMEGREYLQEFSLQEMLQRFSRTRYRKR